MIGAQVVAVAQGRLSTVGAFVMCGLWQLVLAAGFAICGAAAAATVPTAPAKQASPTFSFAEMEDAYNALNRTIIASEVFDDDDAYSSKLMNDDDRRNARDALETLGKIVNRWKSDLRLYKHMKVSRPVQIKKKS